MLIDTQKYLQDSSKHSMVGKINRHIKKKKVIAYPMLAAGKA